MDKTTLVEMKIDEGWEVLNALDNAGLLKSSAKISSLQSAFWHYSSEDGEWKLFLASPLVRTKGQTILYKEIREVLNEINPPTQIILDDILLLSPQDPRIRSVKNISSDEIFVYRLPPLNEQDDAVLFAIVEFCTNNDTEVVESAKFEQSKYAERLDKDHLYESIESLFDLGYLERLAKTADNNYIFRLSPYGFEAFAKDIDRNFEEVMVQTIQTIVEHGVPLDREKLRALIRKKSHFGKKSHFWTHFVLEVLHKRGWIRLTKFSDGRDVITLITPRGRRAAERAKKVA